MPLSLGAPAPDIALRRDGGGLLRFGDLRGRPVVLYFFPRADTPACTTEALDFSGLAGDFAALGTAIVGVSPDSPRKQDRFRDKYGLNLMLLADEDHALAEAYGVWVEKSMYGRRYMGVERTTFLIGADGIVARVWDKVKVAGHAEAVLAAARALSEREN